jgi:hypothetical protein
MLRLAVAALLSFFLLLPAVTAQFQFFGDFFGQQGQQQAHQQEKQNVGSDSSWYRQTWETGKHFKNSRTCGSCIRPWVHQMQVEGYCLMGLTTNRVMID